MRPAIYPQTFEAVCEELDRRRRVALGFERINALLFVLGNPERDLDHIVQVVGTNGKGTTALALAAAVQEMGHPSGAYLSPHVLSYTERVMVGGRTVSEGAFAGAMGEAIEAADENGIPATQFELLTVGALKMFRDAGLSWAVLEAGLGARHDATTAAEPEAVALTNVGLDHTEYLGGTVEEISREKLASLRRGTTLVLGTDDPRVVEAARQESGAVGARLVQIGDVGKEDFPPTGLVPYAAHNVAFGFRTAEVLLGQALTPEAREQAARRLEGALPARFEEHKARGVPVVVDGGHNPGALEATIRAVRARYGDRPLSVVFGVLKDKDVGSMLTLIAREADRIVLTRPADAGDRAAEPEHVARKYDPRGIRGNRAPVVEDVGEALVAALGEMRGVGGVVLVTGSFYTASGVLEGLRGGAFG